MKVFVVGGWGFIGNELVSKLTGENHEVIILSKSDGKLQHKRQSRRSSTVIGNLFNEKDYLEILKKWKPDVVVQSAWCTDISNYRTNIQNLEFMAATVLLAQHCFRLKIDKFIGIGSCAELEFMYKNLNTNEKDLIKNDLYGFSKIETHKRIDQLSQEWNSNYMWVRIFQPYGKEQDAKRFIPMTYSNIRKNEIIELQNPYKKLDWISSRDVADGIHWAIEKELSGIVDLGTGKSYTTLDIVEKISNLLQKNAIIKLAKDSETKINKIFEKSPIVVADKNSNIFQSGWLPKDNIDSGLIWALDL